MVKLLHGSTVAIYVLSATDCFFHAVMDSARRGTSERLESVCLLLFKFCQVLQRTTNNNNNINNNTQQQGTLATTAVDN
jgi:hypothetical protein